MAMMRRVDNGVKILSRDFEAVPPSQPLQLAFDLFETNWKEFFDTHQSLFSRILDSTYDMVESFERQLNIYRRAYLKEGGQTALSELKPRKKSAGSGIEMSPTGIALTATGGGLLVLLFLLVLRRLV
jgi:hypothetical protein